MVLPRLRQHFIASFGGSSARVMTLADVELAVVLMRLLATAPTSPPGYGPRLVASWSSAEELHDHLLFTSMEHGVPPPEVASTAAERLVVRPRLAPYETMRYDTVSYHTIRCHSIAYDTIQYQTVRYDTIPHRTAMPCHTTPHHTIP